MWYVINRTNGQKLVKFKKKIIVPLFEYMIKYKNEKITVTFEDFLNHKIKDNKKILGECDKILCKRNLKCVMDKKQIAMQKINSMNVLLYICKRKINKVCFTDCVNKLLRDYSDLQLKMHIYVYYRQNKELKEKAMFIEEKDVPSEWNYIFVEFFYKKFFSDEKIWEQIEKPSCGTLYTREIFHENFMDDNSIFVCPYCDSSEISDVGNLYVEHFLPKSRYPFLSMNQLNLYSSCKACNEPATGKGTNTVNPTVLPFYEQIGDRVSFIPDITTSSIKIVGETEAIRNYIDLFQLEKRYSKKHKYKLVHQLTSRVYNTISEAVTRNGAISDKEIEKYIEYEAKYKQRTHYFAVASIMRNYNKYLGFVGGGT